MRIAVIGATGNVGRKVVGMLLDAELVTPRQLTLFASQRSAGKILTVNQVDFTVHDAETANFAEFSLSIFNTENDVSEQYIPLALAAGNYVVDSSSSYRLQDDVPLIIPPVNRKLINARQKLYAHANCLASPIATVLAPIQKVIPIKRVNVSTWQATSGAGKAASDECLAETQAVLSGDAYQRQQFKRQIAFNVIPEIGSEREDGMTGEEYKIIHEVQKVLAADIAINATSVRVPVVTGHSMALNLEFFNACSTDDIINILQTASSIVVDGKNYTTPVEVEGSDDVHVGRIRRDNSVAHGINLWLCSDNLRRGAATDSVEIVQEIIACL